MVLFYANAIHIKKIFFNMTEQLQIILFKLPFL